MIQSNFVFHSSLGLLQKIASSILSTNVKGFRKSVYESNDKEVEEGMRKAQHICKEIPKFETELMPSSAKPPLAEL